MLWKKFALGMAMLGLPLLGLVGSAAQRAGPAQDNAKIALLFHKDPDKSFKSGTMRFGVVLPGVKFPKNPKFDKKLTYDPAGRTSNVCVKIDGDERLFGSLPGQWQQQEGKLGQDARGKERHGLRSVWVYPNEQVTVTQTVEVARGEQTFAVDTCWVRYTLENKDNQAHNVGLRFLLDTFIGTNDGAPFIIPGEKELCETSKEYVNADKVPDFVHALESFNFQNPGVIAHLKLKLGGKVEPPGRVAFGNWPDERLRLPGAQGLMTMWNVPVVSMQRTKDSAAFLYWDEKNLQPKEKRELGFSYGLGNFSGNETGDLGLILAGTFQATSDLTVLALVKNPAANQTLTLRLTDGLERKDGAETQPVPAGGINRVSPVTWKVRAGRDGVLAVGVESSTGAFHHQGLQINKKADP